VHQIWTASTFPVLLYTVPPSLSQTGFTVCVVPFVSIDIQHSTQLLSAFHSICRDSLRRLDVDAVLDQPTVILIVCLCFVCRSRSIYWFGFCWSRRFVWPPCVDTRSL